jgi:hypothetical protein
MKQRIRTRTLILLSTFMIGGLAYASGPQDFAGTWTMKIAGKNLFVLKIEIQGDTIRGTYQRPAKYDMANLLFADIQGVRTDSLVGGRFRDGVLRFIIQNANDPNDKDQCALTLHGDRAELSIEGLPPGVIVTPRVFVRAPDNAQVASDWQPNRGYSASDADTPNAEMTAIFDADQKDRTSDHVDWNAVTKADGARREQTRRLLEAGTLHTGEDYQHAAFVFQHGDSAADYLLAHTLAMVAVAKGKATAIWIAAATLDRYLQNIGQKQIFGTQFLTHSENGAAVWTQAPYDRTLISDALRDQLGVPAEKVQEEQLKAYQDQK